MNDVLTNSSIAAWLGIYENEWSRIRALAILITGCVRTADAAIEESIELLDIEAVPRAFAVFAAVAAACTAYQRKSSVDYIAKSILAEQFHAITELASSLRVCFVLRRFAGLTAAETATLLSMEPDEIEQYAARASVQLAEAVSCAA